MNSKKKKEKKKYPPLQNQEDFFLKKKNNNKIINHGKKKPTHTTKIEKKYMSDNCIRRKGKNRFLQLEKTMKVNGMKRTHGMDWRRVANNIHKK